MNSINLDKFKEYAEINVENLDKFPEINFIDNLVNQMQKDLDDMYYKFLNKNGYKLEKPYTIEQVEKIKEDLAKEDKFLDCVQYTDFDWKNNHAGHYILPFFNSLSHPYTQEERDYLLERFKEVNRKDK